MDEVHAFLRAWAAWGLDVPRAVLAVGGLLLLLWGGSFYRLALVVPGALLGAVLAPLVVDGGRDPVLLAGVTLGLSAAGALLALFLEALALRVAGALLGGAVAAMAAPVTPASLDPVAPWLPLVGGLLGAMLLPPVFRAAIRVVVPLLGALALARAAGRPQDLLLVAGLWAVGVFWQLGRARAA